MQWDGTKNAGFTRGKPWLKINNNFKDVNVEKELNDTESLLNTYIRLIKLRKTEEVFSYGKYTDLKFKNGLLQFTRKHREKEITVYINFGHDMEIVLPNERYQVLYGCDKRTLPKNGTLILKS